MGDDPSVSISRELHTRVLTDEEVERVHTRSLEILDRAGISTSNARG